VLTISVITVSDRASIGAYEDRSGPAVAAEIAAAHPQWRIRRAVVPDEVAAILAALQEHGDSDWILTTGGTGLSPRDVTPETTRAFCDRELPGIAEWLRRESQAETAYACLSRGFSGQKGRSIVVNFPGSERAALFCIRLLLPVLEHGPAMAAGHGH
jgi:molybdopterin adenylyltransferase